MNNKKILIIGIIFLIVITLVIINIIKPHKTKEIVLKTNGGVSYNWEYTIENTDIIGIEDEKSEEKSHEIVGGEIEKHFIFLEKLLKILSIKKIIRSALERIIIL